MNDKNVRVDWQPNEHVKAPFQTNELGFLQLLVLAATCGLLYLFSSFLMPIIFAGILACSTYPIFLKIKNKFNITKNRAAGLTTMLVFIVLIAPIGYLLTVVGVEATVLYDTYPTIVNGLDFSSLDAIKPYLLEYTPLSNESVTYISEQIAENSVMLKDGLKDSLLFLSKTILNSSMGMLGFFAISLFTLFFFYRDGNSITERLKVITPLHDYYDTLLMKEISSLSGILMFSVLSIALLQGLSFAILTFFMDLDWVFIGIAIAVSSFIPIFGSMLVWVPLSLYLYGSGNWFAGGLVIFWGAFISGFVIDNLMRPFVMGKICGVFSQDKNDDDFSPLEHTLLVILSTIGGVITFGVLGLFLGPIIAAFSISIYGIYVIRLQNLVPTDEIITDETTDTNDIEEENNIIDNNI
jgi:predicted PurR-regulated permease PerM